MLPSGCVVLLASLFFAASGVAQPSKEKILKLSASQEAALKQSVAAFWEAWKARNYEKASKLVEKDQQARFQRLRKFPIRNWRIESIICRSHTHEVEVTVLVERFEPIMGGYFTWRHVAKWVETKSKWYLKLPPSN